MASPRLPRYKKDKAMNEDAYRTMKLLLNLENPDPETRRMTHAEAYRLIERALRESTGRGELITGWYGVVQ